MCSECGHYHCTPGCPNYEPIIADICVVCDGNIYEGDKYIDNLFGESICEKCYSEMTKEELIDKLGLKIKIAKVEERW